jgi:hypothetical protein
MRVISTADQKARQIVVNVARLPELRGAMPRDSDSE